MEKPGVVTIKDEDGIIIFMEFIDIARLDEYKMVLQKLNGTYIKTETNKGEKIYTMPEYVLRLLRGNND